MIFNKNYRMIVIGGVNSFEGKIIIPKYDYFLLNFKF